MENYFNLKKIENCERLKKDLENHGVIFMSGLSEEETSRAEQMYAFVFPPDLRLFLQHALPISKKGEKESIFPNWRDLGNKNLNFYIHFPLDGILFDVDHGAFWLNELGPRPQDNDEAKKMMIAAVNKAPFLIPVYGHRYIPAEPSEENNPVISVVQTDIIYYGSCLYDYFQIEFCNKERAIDRNQLKKIKFWSTIIERN